MVVLSGRRVGHAVLRRAYDEYVRGNLRARHACFHEQQCFTDALSGGSGVFAGADRGVYERGDELRAADVSERQVRSAVSAGCEQYAAEHGRESAGELESGDAGLSEDGELQLHGWPESESGERLDRAADADGIYAGEQQPPGGNYGVHDAVAERSDAVGG